MESTQKISGGWGNTGFKVGEEDRRYGERTGRLKLAEPETQTAKLAHLQRRGGNTDVS